jgi:hypothetical protein
MKTSEAMFFCLAICLFGVCIGCYISYEVGALFY